MILIHIMMAILDVELYDNSPDGLLNIWWICAVMDKRYCNFLTTEIVIVKDIYHIIIVMKNHTSYMFIKELGILRIWYLLCQAFHHFQGSEDNTMSHFQIYT